VTKSCIVVHRKINLLVFVMSFARQFFHVHGVGLQSNRV